MQAGGFEFVSRCYYSRKHSAWSVKALPTQEKSTNRCRSSTLHPSQITLRYQLSVWVVIPHFPVVVVVETLIAKSLTDMRFYHSSYLTLRKKGTVLGWEIQSTLSLKLLHVSSFLVSACFLDEFKTLTSGWSQIPFLNQMIQIQIIDSDSITCCWALFLADSWFINSHSQLTATQPGFGNGEVISLTTVSSPCDYNITLWITSQTSHSCSAPCLSCSLFTSECRKFEHFI